MPARFTRTLDEMSTMLGDGLEAERTANAPGWLQARDPRAKLLTALGVLLAVSLVHRPAALLAFYLVLVAAAGSTRVPVLRLLRREWLAAGFFSGVVALPALFITPGPPLFALPFGVAVTAPGAEAGARLFLRALASIHVALLMTQTTPWNRLLHGLRGLGVPSLAVMVLTLSRRYIVLLLGLARSMLLGREARRVGRISGATARRQAAAATGALLVRSQDTGEAVYRAMSARGWRGEPRDLEPTRWRAGDSLLCLGAAALCAAVILLDRHAYLPR